MLKLPPCINLHILLIYTTTKLSRDDTHHWDLFPSQSCSQPAINSLEAVLSSEGNVYCEEWEWRSPKKPHMKTTRLQTSTNGDTHHSSRLWGAGAGWCFSSWPPPAPAETTASPAPHRSSSWSHSMAETTREEQGQFFKVTLFLLGAFRFDRAWITFEGSWKSKTQLKTTYLYVVSVGAGLSEDGWDGWITTNFQIIFGAVIPLKKISKEACWFSE